MLLLEQGKQITWFLNQTCFTPKSFVCSRHGWCVARFSPGGFVLKGVFRMSLTHFFQLISSTHVSQTFLNLHLPSFPPKARLLNSQLTCVNCSSSFSCCLLFSWLLACQSVHGSFCSLPAGANKLLKPRAQNQPSHNETLEGWPGNEISGWLIQPNLPKPARFISNVPLCWDVQLFPSVKSRVWILPEFLGEISLFPLSRNQHLYQWTKLCQWSWDELLGGLWVSSGWVASMNPWPERTDCVVNHIIKLIWLLVDKSCS